MKVYPNIFSNNPVNRVSDLRSDPSWVDKTLNSEKTLISLFWRGKAFITKHKNLTSDQANPDQYSPAWFPLNFFEDQTNDSESLIFIGMIDDVAFFSKDVSELSNPEEILNL